MINELSKYHVFSTFNLSSAYHQVKIVESDYKNKAFEANDKLYELTRIPFSVKNGVAAFQLIMSQFVEQENLRAVFPLRCAVPGADPGGERLGRSPPLKPTKVILFTMILCNSVKQHS